MLYGYLHLSRDNILIYRKIYMHKMRLLMSKKYFSNLRCTQCYMMQTFKNEFKYQSYHRKYINWHRKIWELYQMLPLAKKALWALFIKFLYFLYFKIVIVLQMRLKFQFFFQLWEHSLGYDQHWLPPLHHVHFHVNSHISLWICFHCEHLCGNRGADHPSHHCTFSPWTSHVWFFCRLAWSFW